MSKYDDYSPEITYTEERVESHDRRDEPLAPPGKPVSQSKRRRQQAGRKPQRKASAQESKPQRKGSVTDMVKGWATSQNVRLITGIFLGCLGVYLGVSFVSYLASCIADQSLVRSVGVGAISQTVENAGGEGGARLSELLINKCFGLGSAVIVFWLLAMSFKELFGVPKYKSVNFTIKCVVALITVSLIIGLLTIGVDTPVNWGGYHGRYVNLFIVHFCGWTGAVILSIFMVALFVVICLRDIINWLLRLKKAREKRREAKLAAKAAAEERQAIIDEMARRQLADDARAGEHVSDGDGGADTQESADAHVSFVGAGQEGGDALPDFEGDLRSESYVYNEHEDDVPVPSPDDIAGEDINNVGDGVTSDPDEAPEMGDAEEPAETPSGEETAAMVVNVNTIAEADKELTRRAAALPGCRMYKFPPTDLLREGKTRISVDQDEQIENKERIRKTLLDFGIPITSIEATVGPTVTLYEIVPQKGVKIASIRSLVDDIALSLAAIGVRIIAPIPGKGTVGIEVANKEPQTVSMRTILQSKKYQETKYELPVAIGSTISNEVYIADLAKMPHLLVGGATGQGKSVGLNAIIASLLYRKTPDELKFVMIDPKKVEFSLYAKIENHYLAKLPGEDEAIITDMSKVVATLNSLCIEMEDRYQLLRAAHTRNVEEYNNKIKDLKLDPEEGHRYLPYIVVIVDEFSDLIMTAGKEIEIPIARLAQMARAVGMHVIIATQRPSVKVITGLIKANFPARIAFKTTSSTDSKTILDTVGAQQLIGRGDMLVSNSSEMVRVQCAFIDTPEVESICDYIERQPYGRGAYQLPEPPASGGDEGGDFGSDAIGNIDPLLPEVARLIVTSNTASTSSLQRRYAIGYNRAGKIMDQLEAMGVVGPAHGGKPRSVLVDAISLESILDSL